MAVACGDRLDRQAAADRHRADAAETVGAETQRAADGRRAQIQAGGQERNGIGAAIGDLNLPGQAVRRVGELVTGAGPPLIVVDPFTESPPVCVTAPLDVSVRAPLNVEPPRTVPVLFVRVTFAAVSDTAPVKRCPDS
ncbi:MAG: hypothetical protein WDO24_14920 [Pseudomonadota bacterium]